jgi:hypothetical protein
LGSFIVEVIYTQDQLILVINSISDGMSNGLSAGKQIVKDERSQAGKHNQQNPWKCQKKGRKKSGKVPKQNLNELVSWTYTTYKKCTQRYTHTYTDTHTHTQKHTQTHTYT